ncbi:2-succinyl-6-hydroxy-2,4-cyclohexadiene-1-carboxylate synthase [Lonepinella koalarum]|uniref:Putative 2-succinyl-6-hydroxy-2,4-cyclohexadiene-1-carboxylate synthase n=1 Tax=Lonepinella koalarum TaxID=53417 RepID=A0A4R1KY14_9PAST|nr:2-succinyl-6-hydroxy-2,4-cyclohexadiene-1-carboxylate synthase [Lonepinella koalarum]MDH2926586.1 2-succinyl-6-hydroxy-2,4-cyclohexadiene-1-carboxylate synthase [Lonepinella koalarum]TCK69477.1 2-succinyl-6-hydroxy-2,4-cyclohexadiene-1-carboxylate synthase [Lonepinella koalarum]TFJ89724.1 2-succinyl-6-hydroxy-2,4-cyclohexadiene-1-carboxylate synthase [Lonepinella koalarum]TYG33991.1 2-succinyl-6-hydroxy-2,4-cyclohexadiene-1-carboxylate synthase [Lonepinella koalarum]
MPSIIFLHGLLGTNADWHAVIEKFAEKAPQIDCIALDLPLHGENKPVEVTGFEQTAQFVSQQIQQKIQNKPYILVGYSLGGRIALYYALQAQWEKGNLQGLILEGANLGLKNEQEKQQRWQNDQYWAKRFMKENPETVLQDWYQQSVFAHLTEQQRANLIAKRASNCGENIGKMLLATSLAKQPDFSEKVRSKSLPIYYLLGERDRKFCQLAKQKNLHFSIIPNAGHNAHLENPVAFAEQLRRFAFEIAKVPL